MELRIDQPPRFHPLQDTRAAAPLDAAMLALVEPWPDCAIVVASPGGLELACALMRRGFADVTIARPGDRLPHCHADIVLIPGSATLDRLAASLAWARRILAPAGSVVLRSAGASAPGLRQVIPALQMQGFTSIRTRTLAGATLVRADIPLQKQRRCA